jgi:hypothetical protein
MVDGLETLQALEESGSETLGTLNTVVAWLHQEGFYAAESALLGEVENRYPDQLNSRATQSSWEQEPPSQSSTQGSLPREHDIIDLGATSCILEEPCPADVPSSAERCVTPASTSTTFDLLCFSKIKFSLSLLYTTIQGGGSMEK